MYIHGFGSSAQSGTVTRIRETFPNAEVIAYDMPLHPAEAMSLLHDICEREKPDLIIGTSMGGMYAEQLYGIDRICVNPAFGMHDTMKEHGMTGKQQWQNPRADGETEFLVTKALEKEYREICELNFQHAADDNDHVYGLCCPHLRPLLPTLHSCSPLPWRTSHGRQFFLPWRSASDTLDKRHARG